MVLPGDGGGACYYYSGRCLDQHLPHFFSGADIDSDDAKDFGWKIVLPPLFVSLFFFPIVGINKCFAAVIWAVRKP